MALIVPSLIEKNIGPTYEATHEFRLQRKTIKNESGKYKITITFKQREIQAD